MFFTICNSNFTYSLNESPSTPAITDAMSSVMCRTLQVTVQLKRRLPTSRTNPKYASTGEQAMRMRCIK